MALTALSKTAAQAALHSDFETPLTPSAPKPHKLVLAHDAGRTAPALSTLELRVIELARGDGLKSLKPVSQRNWLKRLLLGAPPPSAQLANESLEALRKIAVHAWQDTPSIPDDILDEAFAAGHSQNTIDMVVALVANHPASKHQIVS